ncbi:MAG: hypothetical protein JXA52_08745 [Planctomycetes bacterium]|nr:hypothetical protein [Planctomycetota bacterium]
MNPPRKSKFFLDCLNRACKATGGVDIAYSAETAGIISKIVSALPGVIHELEAFYACKGPSQISIFVYPDITAMSQAFGRELQGEQWCFVPIKGEHSLITFTAKLKQDSIPRVLIHEFSHIYFSRITGNQDVGNYRQSIPLWLDEGIALHLDSKFRHNLEQVLRKRCNALKSPHGYFPKLMDLYTYFNRLDEDEFGIKAEMAYSFSYFCVQDLIEQFGSEHLIAFINKPDLANNFTHLFKSHFNSSLPEFNYAMTKKYGGAAKDSPVDS